MKIQLAIDDLPLSFGKHKGKTPRAIAETDPGYIVWLRANKLPPVVSRDLALDCEDKVNEDRESEDESW